MGLKEILTKERKLSDRAIRIIDTLTNTPYIYGAGPLFGLVLGVIGSSPVDKVRRAIRPDLEKFDWGNTFGERFMFGYTSCRNAFTYRPQRATNDYSGLGEGI
ncbi:Uncharacterised protein [uncultured archaeon]|nr:Uncharacterised protein [uncultured archaeon]